MSSDPAPSDAPRAGLPLGTLDAGVLATVGTGGEVHVVGSEWVVEWWVGAEDRWHRPTVEPAVRQSLLDDSPVVVTSMRVPGGDLVHRAAGGRAQGDGWSGSGAVVEVENQTAVPVALAVVVRPASGHGPVGTPLSTDGTAVRAGGRTVALLSRPAARATVGPLESLVERLGSGDDDVPPVSGEVAGAGGPTAIAVVVPLAHTAVVRVLVPGPVGAPTGRRRRPVPAGPSGAWDAPDAAAVAAGWSAHTAEAARLELPEPSATGFLVRAERALLLGAIGAAAELLDRRPGPAARPGAAVLLDLVDALARCGLEDPLGPVAASLAAAQRFRGAVPVGDGSDATVALVGAAASLLGGRRPERWMDDLVGPVARSVDRLSRGRGLDGADPARAATAIARLAAALRDLDQPDLAAWADEVAGSLDPGFRGATTGRVLQALDATAVPTTPVDVGDRARGVVDVLDGLVAWTPAGLRLCDGWAVSWAGQDVEVLDVRTPWGRAGFALRWHETRPAVLWEVVPGPGRGEDDPPRLTAERLDPDWVGDGWEGEALLAPPPGAAPPAAGTASGAPGEGESFG